MTFADIDHSVEPQCIKVTTAWNEKELIKAIPGARYKRYWQVPLTWAACLQLKGTFGKHIQFSAELIDWMWNTRTTKIEPALIARSKINSDGEFLDSDKLYPFQNAAIEFKRIIGSGILGDDMGCGKTIESLAYLHELGKDGLPAIIICPNTLKYHWAERIHDWIPEASVYVYGGTPKQRQQTLRDAAIDPHAIVIINYEAVRKNSRLAPFANIRLKRCLTCDKTGGDPGVTTRTCEIHPRILNSIRFVSVFIDEAHKIKNPRAQQTRAIWAICHNPGIQHVWAITGTPIANSVRDLWSILHAIDPISFPTLSKYIDRYALISWNAFGGLEVVGLKPETKDEFYAIFLPTYRRMRKEEVLPQLPHKLHTVRLVELSLIQRRMYSEMQLLMLSQTDTQQLLITSSHSTATIRLSQLACAALDIVDKPNPDDPATWKVRLKDPSSKIDELLSVIEELGERKAVIAAEHSQLIRLASARLDKNGIPHCVIDGETTPTQRANALVAFNEGRVKLLLITTKAGGIGLDMSAASCLIWLQHPWSMIEYLQTENRIHRVGSEQHAKLDIIHIVASNTLEEEKLKALKNKLQRLDEITRDSIEAEQISTSYLI